MRIKKSGSIKAPHEYLQIVESYRDGKSVRQRVIATLGRLDQLKASGQIDGLVKSLARFSETLRVLSAAKDPRISTCVERTIREEKSTLEVRPIFHHRDDTSIGHIVASFLALRLEVDLQRRLDDKGLETSWPDLMWDLKQLQAVQMDLDGKSYLIRTDFEGVAYDAFKAAGVQPPKRVMTV